MLVKIATDNNAVLSSHVESVVLLTNVTSKQKLKTLIYKHFEDVAIGESCLIKWFDRWQMLVRGCCGCAWK
jgi:hypothetical protein